MQLSVRKIIYCLLTIVFLVSCGFSQEQDEPTNKVDRPLKILSKPRTRYTDEARKNNVQGTVKLEVTFLADKTIGEITCVNEDNEQTKRLKKYGLVASAIEAAKKIKFEPEIKDGNPVTIKNIQTYTFSIY